MSHTLEAHKQYQPSGSAIVYQQREKADHVNHWANAIAPKKTVLAAIKSQLYFFASRTALEAQFSDTSKSIFERYQVAVDQLLTNRAPQAFDRLPHVFERLSNGDAEAISHALTSCRRIVDSFAEAMFPARADLVQIGDQQLDCSTETRKIKFEPMSG